MTDKRCFVIAPIGVAGSPTRERSDKILRHVIRPAVQPCGYEVQRADEIADPGIITTQVINRIVTDELVIADLSERNPNVYYELCLRHALRKPLVQLIDKDEPLPFDVAQMRTIAVDYRDLDSVEAARKEIVSQVSAMEKSGREIDTPISISVDLQNLTRSAQPEQSILVDVRDTLTQLSSELRKHTTVLNSMATTHNSEMLDFHDDDILKDMIARFIDAVLPKIPTNTGPFPQTVSNLARHRRQRRLQVACDQLFETLRADAANFD